MIFPRVFLDNGANYIRQKGESTRPLSHKRSLIKHDRSLFSVFPSPFSSWPKTLVAVGPLGMAGQMHKDSRIGSVRSCCGATTLKSRPDQHRIRDRGRKRWPNAETAEPGTLINFPFSLPLGFNPYDGRMQGFQGHVGDLKTIVNPPLPRLQHI